MCYICQTMKKTPRFLAAPPEGGLFFAGLPQKPSNRGCQPPETSGPKNAVINQAKSETKNRKSPGSGGGAQKRQVPRGTNDFTVCAWRQPCPGPHFQRPAQA